MPIPIGSLKKIPFTRWVVLLVSLLLLGLLMAAIATNLLGLRTALFLDTKIHRWNLQSGQVLQRPAEGNLSVQLTGRVGWLSRRVDVAIASPQQQTLRPQDWQVLDPAPHNTYFKGSVNLPPGWVKVFGRSHGQKSRRTNAMALGVGEVFIIAGQSNAVGSSKTLTLTTSTDVRTGQFQEDGSVLWKPGDDPQVAGAGGSPWPLVGQALVQELGVPVAFINVATGSSSIQDWQPGSKNLQKLFRALDLCEPYGVRAILWHQGERDRRLRTEDYYRYISRMIQAVRQRSPVTATLPWLVAQATYAKGKTAPAIARAQQQLWQQGLALPGPNTDVLQADYRQASDQVHFNEMGNREVAKLWLEKINTAFFAQAQKQSASLAPDFQQTSGKRGPAVSVNR